MIRKVKHERHIAKNKSKREIKRAIERKEKNGIKSKRNCNPGKNFIQL